MPSTRGEFPYPLSLTHLALSGDCEAGPSLGPGICFSPLFPLLVATAHHPLCLADLGLETLFASGPLTVFSPFSVLLPASVSVLVVNSTALILQLAR